jgi:hypothetical protein
MRTTTTASLGRGKDMLNRLCMKEHTWLCVTAHGERYGIMALDCEIAVLCEFPVWCIECVILTIKQKYVPLIGTIKLGNLTLKWT